MGFAVQRKMNKEFWMAIRQALLGMVDAIERMGQREGWYSAPLTSDARKLGAQMIE